jgi:hypothetical protein
VKLGYEISDESIRRILRRLGIPPSPERTPSPSWRHLMAHYKMQILACDFFMVETLFPQMCMCSSSLKWGVGESISRDAQPTLMERG